MTERVILPRTATVEMALYGARSIGKTMGVQNHNERAHDCYNDMLAASPNAGEVTEEELRRAVQAHVARRCLTLDCPEILDGLTMEEMREELDSMRAALASLGLTVEG